MFMRSSLAALAAVSMSVGSPASAQEAGRTHLKLNLPPDSPVALVSADWGESRAAARGGAMLLDLHTALSLRNSSQRRIRGITLLVEAQAVTPGGKASVSVPSLDVAPGETFPVRLDLRLLRPLQTGAGPLVNVELDGVLFHDLTFYGPDRLNSRRSMTVWELEARRDRKHFQAVLQAGGSEALKQEVLASIERQDARPRIDVQLARGRSTNAAIEKNVQLAFLDVPDAPVELIDGMAVFAGNEARAPVVTVRNDSRDAISNLELGWIFRDRAGREFLGGSVPAGVKLAPGQKLKVEQQTALRLSQGPGQPVMIEGMTGYVSSVEFGDGRLWIPSRSALSSTRLQRILTPSPEEQRLTDLYRRKGIQALIAELGKF